MEGDSQYLIDSVGGGSGEILFCADGIGLTVDQIEAVDDQGPVAGFRGETSFRARQASHGQGYIHASFNDSEY